MSSCTCIDVIEKIIQGMDGFVLESPPWFIEMLFELELGQLMMTNYSCYPLGFSHMRLVMFLE